MGCTRTGPRLGRRLGQELRENILTGFGNNEFFSLLENPKMHPRLRKLAEMFLAQANADDVRKLDFSEGAKAAIMDIRHALAALLVLLVPTPGHMNCSVSDVSYIVTYDSQDKGNSNQDFLSTLQLFLQDAGPWQAKVDECLTVGTSSIKLGKKIMEATQALKESVDSVDSGFTEMYVEVVNNMKEWTDALRPGALADLQSLVFTKTKSLVEQMCTSDQVTGVDSGNVQLLSKALDGFPLGAVANLKKKFQAWKNRVQKHLNAETLKTLADAIMAGAGQEDYEIPLQKLKQALDKCGGEVTDDTKQTWKSIVWAVLTKVHNQALFSLEVEFNRV